jgi:hypothetical protein
MLKLKFSLSILHPFLPLFYFSCLGKKALASLVACEYNASVDRIVLKVEPAGLDVASHYATSEGPSLRFQDFKTANPDSF